MRIAVVGTYRSGSSAVAGILHHLGVDMGAPFWGATYEAADLGRALRQWWSEPQLTAAMASAYRISHLRSWVEAREKSASTVGAKHPLLSLSGPDLLEAWGTSTKFIWCQRPVEESIESLSRAGWWPDAGRIQNFLHHASVEFFEEQDHLAVTYAHTLEDPLSQVRFLADALQLDPNEEQINNAVQWIRAWPGNGASVAKPVAYPRDQQVRSQPSRQPRVIATILSGNSELLVVDAVRSVVDWVDAICLIDTGITDGTIERATEIAGQKVSVARFPWRKDFSAARNAALKFAEELNATWALTIDTDERLEFHGIRERQHLYELLEASPEVCSWMVSARNGTYSKERFIRVPSNLLWRGRTHEALTGTQPHERKHLAGCRFWEVHKSADGYQQKVRRDLEILLEETAAQPLNPRWWYYLGQTHEGLKQFQEAVDAYERCIRLDGWADESAWACYTAARCLVEMKEYRAAEEYCGLGMTRKSSAPEFPWLAGWCCQRRGALRQAVSWSRIAIVLGRDKCVENAASFRHMPAWYEAPYDVLRFTFRQLNMPRDAALAEQDYEAAKADRLRLYPAIAAR